MAFEEYTDSFRTKKLTEEITQKTIEKIKYYLLADNNLLHAVNQKIRNTPEGSQVWHDMSPEMLKEFFLAYPRQFEIYRITSSLPAVYGKEKDTIKVGIKFAGSGGLRMVKIDKLASCPSAIKHLWALTEAAASFVDKAKIEEDIGKVDVSHIAAATVSRSKISDDMIMAHPDEMYRAMYGDPPVMPSFLHRRARVTGDKYEEAALYGESCYEKLLHYLNIKEHLPIVNDIIAAKLASHKFDMSWFKFKLKDKDLVMQESWGVVNGISGLFSDTPTDRDAGPVTSWGTTPSGANIVFDIRLTSGRVVSIPFYDLREASHISVVLWNAIEKDKRFKSVTAKDLADIKTQQTIKAERQQQELIAAKKYYKNFGTF